MSSAVLPGSCGLHRSYMTLSEALKPAATYFREFDQNTNSRRLLIV